MFFNCSYIVYGSCCSNSKHSFAPINFESMIAMMMAERPDNKKEGCTSGGEPRRNATTDLDRLRLQLTKGLINCAKWSG